MENGKSRVHFNGATVPYIRPYFLGIFPYIAVTYGGHLQFRFLKRSLKRGGARVNAQLMQVSPDKSMVYR